VACYAVYHEVVLLLRLHDTSAAIKRLDEYLAALPTVGSNLITVAPDAALLVRMMVLRAELADELGDRRGARHWGAAVATLWQDADFPLHDTVQRMRTLAARNGG
jgi:hypothetical protein